MPHEWRDGIDPWDVPWNPAHNPVREPNDLVDEIIYPAKPDLLATYARMVQKVRAFEIQNNLPYSHPPDLSLANNMAHEWRDFNKELEAPAFGEPPTYRQLSRAEYNYYKNGHWVPLQPEEQKMRSFIEIVQDMLKYAVVFLNTNLYPSQTWNDARARMYALWTEMGRLFGKYMVLDEAETQRYLESQKTIEDRQMLNDRIKELDERWIKADRAAREAAQVAAARDEDRISEKNRADTTAVELKRVRGELHQAYADMKTMEKKHEYWESQTNYWQTQYDTTVKNVVGHKETIKFLEKELADEKLRNVGYINKLITLRVQGNVTDMNSIKITQTEIRDR